MLLITVKTNITGKIRLCGGIKWDLFFTLHSVFKNTSNVSFKWGKEKKERKIRGKKRKTERKKEKERKEKKCPAYLLAESKPM